MTEKIEFIESYIKNGNSDYQWNDNNGELIRCKNCKFGWSVQKQYEIMVRETSVKVLCGKEHYSTGPNWYCADDEKKEGCRFLTLRRSLKNDDLF